MSNMSHRQSLTVVLSIKSRTLVHARAHVLPLGGGAMSVIFQWYTGPGNSNSQVSTRSIRFQQYLIPPSLPLL